MTNTPYSIVVTLSDGTRRTVSDHEDLTEAAHIAFRLAEDLSEDNPAYDAREVAVYHDDRLDLGIAVLPGRPL